MDPLKKDQEWLGDDKQTPGQQDDSGKGGGHEIDKHGERFSLFRSMDQQKRTILVMCRLSPVEPVNQIAIASGSDPELWHVHGSAAVKMDDVLKYYELTKVWFRSMFVITEVLLLVNWNETTNKE